MNDPRAEARALRLVVTRTPLLDLLEEADPGALRAKVGPDYTLAELVRRVFERIDTPDELRHADWVEARADYSRRLARSELRGGVASATPRDALADAVYWAGYVPLDLLALERAETAERVALADTARESLAMVQSRLRDALELAGVPDARRVWRATLADARRQAGAP